MDCNISQEAAHHFTHSIKQLQRFAPNAVQITHPVRLTIGLQGKSLEAFNAEKLAGIAKMT
jgi:hypothetical protein